MNCTMCWLLLVLGSLSAILVHSSLHIRDTDQSRDLIEDPRLQLIRLMMTSAEEGKRSPKSGMNPNLNYLLFGRRSAADTTWEDSGLSEDLTVQGTIGREFCKRARVICGTEL